MNSWGFQPFHRLGGFQVTAKIEVTFTGGMTMNDIGIFNLPGIGHINPSDLLSSVSPLDVYISLGQSNMGGLALIASQDELPVTNSFVLTSDNDGFIPMTNPLNIFSNIEKSGALTSNTNKLAPTYNFAGKLQADN